MGKIIFILGGARSGKSTFAVTLAKKMSRNVLYLATAQPKDKEMAERIKCHKKSRPPSWRTIEEPIKILSILAKAPKEKVVLIDCLTLYISNLLTGKQKNFKTIERQVINNISALVRIIKNFKKHTFIVVSNEVGLGIVPTNPLTRYFRDIAGRANQIFTQNSEEVYFLNAGLPIKIK